MKIMAFCLLLFKSVLKTGMVEYLNYIYAYLATNLFCISGGDKGVVSNRLGSHGDIPVVISIYLFVYCFLLKVIITLYIV